MLGDMGADIVKVERPIVGDDTRRWGPPFTETGHESAYFISVNRNKRSIAIDLKREAGQELVTKLIERSDIVIDNFAPGDARKLGLDREEIRTSNDRLIWCSITGYGPDGPLANRLGYAVLVEAHAGLMNATGPRGGDPVKAGVALTDVLTGLHASTSILAALHHRSMTGKGTSIDCSLLESQVSGMVNIASNYLIAGQDSQRLGTGHASIVPYGCVRTRDGMMALAAGNDKQFEGLCECLGLRHLSSDDRFKSNSARVKNRDHLIASLESVTTRKSASEWIDIFNRIEGSDKFAFAPVNNMKQVFQDPQVLHRNMVLEVDHLTAGRIKLPGVPFKFPDFPANEGHTAPPVLGQHSREVLESVLGYSENEIQKLINDKVVFP